MKRYAKYGRLYADAPKSQMASVTSSELPAMDVPPSEPPPPPPMLRNFDGGASSGPRTADTSRDDASEGHRSRNTVREIPVQRATSAFAPSSTMTMEYRTSSTQPWSASAQPHAEEYYRREVMTRTLVTRSTEALSVPPLGRSSPIDSSGSSYRYPSVGYPDYREEKTVDYNYKYTRNVEEEERRVKENQEKRRREEEERRRREEELRRKWEIEERERLERLRREFELQEHEMEKERLAREQSELGRLERDRQERKLAEERRRQEWERNEHERRLLEEQELEKQRELERKTREKLARERAERERIERERLERERLLKEAEEQRRLEEERRERERIEIERLEIERIERIKRERIERERLQREKEREEAERLERERLELERLERERLELERQERELLEMQRREEEQRERERRDELLRETLRREEEAREKELLRELERQALERENQRRLKERQEQERLEAIRREQERRELERQDLERKERERKEDERREQELLAAQRRAMERREQERLADEARERERREEERRAMERRELERREAEEREERRRAEEEQERQRLAELAERAARRRAEREEELLREKRLEQMLREAEEQRELDRLEAERRAKERDEEQRRLLELKETQRRLAEERDRERRDAERREEERRRNAHRSRDRLDLIHKELEDKERLEREKRRRNLELERRHKLTSRETLEGLTRAPYFSRENLAPEVTTKVERQVIERVDRTLWTQDGLDSSVDPEGPRERLYNPRRLDDEDFQRGSSRRTSRYKAKMEKARREFLTEPGQPGDLVADRFRKSAEDLQRRKPELRGPLLQKFHSGEFSSKPGDLDLIPAPGYSRMGPSPYEEEYNRLKAEAERNLAHYRLRSSQPNLVARSRTTSVGYLETDVDSGLQRTVDEAEDLRRSKSALDYESTSTRQSRKEQMDGEAEAAHTRSKSADFLMDRRTREESAPPENELQKTADASHRDLGLSEHELRFRKSVEKLQTPDWYREHVERMDSTLNSTSDPLPPAPRSLSRQTWSQHDAPVGGIALPSGMFDRYRGEIEDLRRSRTSLHQATTPTQHTKNKYVTFLVCFLCASACYQLGGGRGGDEDADYGNSVRLAGDRLPHRCEYGSQEARKTAPGLHGHHSAQGLGRRQGRACGRSSRHLRRLPTRFRGKRRRPLLWPCDPRGGA
uniref:CCDC66 domain-containing protein n=1 Tax=Steinernema glaseri TaxID=37863 RepID=A0A1I7ZXU7_9BILA